MKVTWNPRWIRHSCEADRTVPWKWHESIMNPRWICDESDIEARRSFLRWIQLLVWIFSGKNNKNQKEESAMKGPWNLHESDILPKMKLKLGKKNKSTTNTDFLDNFFQQILADCTQVRLVCESAMKLPWKWHESDMILIFWDWKKLRQCRFMSCSWHFILKTTSKLSCLFYHVCVFLFK